MDAVQRNALIDAAENCLAEMGVADMYLGAQRLKRLLDIALVFVNETQSRERLDTFLAVCSEEDERQIGEMLMLLAAAPQLIRSAVEDAVVQTAETVPIRSGRRTKLTVETKRKIIAKVSTLYNNNRVSVGIAQMRAAAEFQISKRTVQTVWQEREKLAKQPFHSTGDIWRFLRIPTFD